MPLQPGDVPNSYADIKKSKKMLSFNLKQILMGIVKFMNGINVTINLMKKIKIILIGTS